jgi:hypothetical protein
MSEWNPEKNSPVKIDLNTLSKGLTKRQMDKIKYACDLLRRSPQKPLTLEELLVVAPFLFQNGITEANTESTVEEETEDPITEPLLDLENGEYNPEESYYFDGVYSA